MNWFESIAQLVADWEATFEGPWFDDLEAIVRKEQEEREKLERYRARQQTNTPKAIHIMRRIKRLEAIDLHRMTHHIPPDWFGERHLQFAEVQRLYIKKSRMLWYLKGLYHYLMFGLELPSWKAKRGVFAYSKHRAYYAKLLPQHAEKLKQARWDAKRARVKAAREKREANKLIKEQENFNLRRGLNNTPRIKPNG